MRFKDLQAKISIHALRVEGDHVAPETGRRIEIFLSTPSGWRATELSVVPDLSNFISIHALRVEGDYWNGGQTTAYRISIHALRVEGDRRKLLRV